MSIVLMHDGINCDSAGWRPKAPKDSWDITLQVVQRFDPVNKDQKPGGPITARKPAIELTIEHGAEDTEATCYTCTPLTPETARKLASILVKAAKVAEEDRMAT